MVFRCDILRAHNGEIAMVREGRESPANKHPESEAAPAHKHFAVNQRRPPSDVINQRAQASGVVVGVYYV